MAENISLDQLAGNIPMGGTINPADVKPVDVTQFNQAQETPDTPARNAMEKEAYDSIDAGIARYVNEFHEEMLDIKEKAAENDTEDNITLDTVSEATTKEYTTDDEETDTEDKASAPEQKKEESVSKEVEEEDKEEVETENDEADEDIDFDSDDSDLSDLDVDDDEAKESEEDEIDATAIYEDYKNSIKQNINLIANDDLIDISAFKRGNKISSTRALDKTAPAVKYSADHVLYTTGRSIAMEPLDSDEIVQFNPNEIAKIYNTAERNIRLYHRDKDEEQLIATVNSFRLYNKLFYIIYKHITSEKPDYNTWLKSINWADLEDLMFLGYKATYGVVSNKVTVSCEDKKCSHIFVQDFNVQDMLAFKDDAARERYNKIMQLPDNSVLEAPKRIEKQVSRDYVVTLKAPSLYTMVVESTSLSMENLRKHSNLFNIYQYIDKIEYIDREAGELREIEFKEYADTAKTVKLKLKAIANILNTMTTDQKQAILAATSELDRDPDEFYYVSPETKCEKCGKVIEKQRIQSAELLFTRFQLIAHLS